MDKSVLNSKRGSFLDLKPFKIIDLDVTLLLERSVIKKTNLARNNRAQVTKREPCLFDKAVERS